jgi:hypothetical protein
MHAFVAARIAVATVRATLDRLSCRMDVTFCCFSDRDLEIYSALLTTSDG